MRCKNCGWDNPDENTKCEKCNAPLNFTLVAKTRAKIRKFYSRSINRGKIYLRFDVFTINALFVCTD